MKVSKVNEPAVSDGGGGNSMLGSITKAGRIRDYTVFTVIFLLLTAAACSMGYYGFYLLNKYWKPGPEDAKAERNARNSVWWILLLTGLPFILFGVIMGFYMVYTFGI